MTRDQNLSLKPRKLRLSPMQGHTLRMLESAGAMEMATALNTLWGLYGDTGRDVFLVEAEGAIRGLHRLGFTTFESCHVSPPLQPDEAEHCLSFGDRVRWEDARECWRWDSSDTCRSTVDLVLTEAGRQALHR